MILHVLIFVGTIGKGKARVRFREYPVTTGQGLGTIKSDAKRAGILTIRSRSS